ncbi:MAG: endonuclease/exonuclease/phosphatase family protein [Bacteroidales bacterium]|nr:endonuclease/exonuclease/phosphatase family protein [Bacteroidales bacterium]
MKRLICIFSACVLVFVACGSTSQVSSTPKGGRTSHIIGFYNLENLFDTVHDEGKNDYQYLPDGSNNWTEEKYAKKLYNMAHVIAAMKEDNGVWHAVLGVSEIENRHVLEDLVAEPEIAAANFQIVHYDGPDRRGVDVGLLYRPEVFNLIATESIPFTFTPSRIDWSQWTREEMDAFKTRDVLLARGTIGGEMFGIFVAHLPSRLGGKGADLRPRGAEIIYQRAMELQKEFPGIKIVVMGDMNDNPQDVSMTEFLRGKEFRSEVTDEDFFDPFLSMIKAGYASLYYQGGNNIFDIIMVNEALANAKEGTFQIQPIVKKKYYGRIFSKPFMTNQSGQYKGTPFRTYSGGAFVGGYSDHYPTYIVVAK